MDEHAERKAPSRPGVLSAFLPEAKALGAPRNIVNGGVGLSNGIVYGTSGMGRENARACISAMAEKGVGSLVNLGFCGALSSDYTCGDVVICDAVINEAGGGSLPSSQSLLFSCLDAVTGCGLSFFHGKALCVDEPVLSEELKMEMQERTGAAVVDMESFAVLEAAKEHGMQALVIRVVLDDARTSVPEFALGLVDAYGRPRPGKIAAALAARPWRISSLLRLAMQQRIAAERLGSLWKCLSGPRGPFSGADWS